LNVVYTLGGKKGALSSAFLITKSYSANFF